MPKYEAIRIPTHGLPWYKQFWVMLSQSREVRLTHDYYIYVKELGQYVKIPREFVCDLASIPRVFWPIIPPDGIFMIGGLLHDFYYRFNCFLDECDRVTNYDRGRHFADDMFLKVNVQVNRMPVINVVGHFFLGIGSIFAWRRHRKNNLFVGDFFKVNQGEIDGRTTMVECT